MPEEINQNECEDSYCLIGQSTVDRLPESMPTQCIRCAGTSLDIERELCMTYHITSTNDEKTGASGPHHRTVAYTCCGCGQKHKVVADEYIALLQALSQKILEEAIDDLAPPKEIIQ